MSQKKDHKSSSIIIFGSSRSKGKTFEAIQLVTKQFPIPILNLADYNVQEFDYNYQQNDDFTKIIQECLAYDTIILATPVYWYTMSAKMKIFVDRFSDLLSVNKHLGKQLQSKNLAVITSFASYPDGINGFEKIFINIARYMKMHYIGCFFYYSGIDQKPFSNNHSNSQIFISKLQKDIT
ncbi:MAG: flavodoxin family protein [Legionellales bacterium]|nr:flavodoxin family protein [Legionellales bacterium]